MLFTGCSTGIEHFVLANTFFPEVLDGFPTSFLNYAQALSRVWIGFLVVVCKISRGLRF